MSAAASAAPAPGAEIDPRIRYPSYKSFDEFIDVERLKSLDGYISERLERHLCGAERAAYDDDFENDHRLDMSTPQKPGVREIWLSTHIGDAAVPDDYLDLDKPELWERTEATDEFSELMAFIATLPFKAMGRMLLIFDAAGHAVPAHRDHFSTHLSHDFLWLRTNRRKPFYLLNEKTREKCYVASYSAWFDTVNQFHGSDAAPGLTFSLRLDGIFKDEFKRQIPVPATRNRAATPALWACLTDEAAPLTRTA